MIENNERQIISIKVRKGKKKLKKKKKIPSDLIRLEFLYKDTNAIRWVQNLLQNRWQFGVFFFFFGRILCFFLEFVAIFAVQKERNFWQNCWKFFCCRIFVLFLSLLAIFAVQKKWNLLQNCCTKFCCGIFFVILSLLQF